MSRRFPSSSTRPTASSRSAARFATTPRPFPRILVVALLALSLVAALATAGTALAQDDASSPDPTQTTAEAPFELRTVAEGLVSPVQLTSPPDDPRRFVVDRIGRIHLLREDGTLADEPFLDITDRLVEFREGFDERGLLGLAFHPNFADNGRYYVYYSAPLRDEAPDDWNHTARVSEFKAARPEEGPRSESDTSDTNSERILLEIDEPQFNHDGGAIDFGPDGFLYIALGDGGAANDMALGHPPMGHGQDVTSMLGNILRINVDRGWPGYAVPPENPFVGDPQGLDEIYAWGWRNPYRMTFDRAGNGDLYAATNGQNLWEAVYLVDEPGNYGWNILEGTHCFDPENPDTPPEECASEGLEGRPLRLPVIEYPHPANQGDSPIAGISVIGGYVYRGDAIPELQGDYVFGDWSLSFREPQGQLFTATPNDPENATQEGDLWPMDKVMQLDRYVIGFGQDADGELYVLTTEATGPTGETGRVHMLVPVGEGDEGASAGSSDASNEGASEEGDASEGSEGSQDGANDGSNEGSGESSDDGSNDGSNEGSDDGSDDGSDSGLSDASDAQMLFTAEQAERGAEHFRQNCQECHGSDLTGVSPQPALIGDAFFSRWEGRTVADLLDYVQTNMPLSDPGSLDDQTYADIVASLLSRYGYAAGESELPADPAAVPNAPVESRGEGSG